MKKLTKQELSFLIINLALITLNFILNYFYQKNGFDFTLKCICSGIFALIGVINLVFALLRKAENKTFYILMTCGLFFAMLGDVVINHYFVPGAGLFAIGHVFFVISFCLLSKIKLIDIIPTSILAVGAVSFLLFAKILHFDPSMLKIVCIIYALIISCMLGKTIGNFINNKSTLNILIMIGAALFFFSDLMLVLDWFILEQYEMSWTNEACMATYYPALCIFAFSMYYKLVLENKNN